MNVTAFAALDRLAHLYPDVTGLFIGAMWLAIIAALLYVGRFKGR